MTGFVFAHLIQLEDGRMVRFVRHADTLEVAGAVVGIVREE